MDARIAGQLSGVAHTIPTRGNSPAGESRAAKPDADSNPAPAQDFDANDDGAIEHWSYSHGGDSYTTFKPPPSGAAGANLRRVGHTPHASAAAHRANAHASTAAAIHHAHEAYQRDGGANASDAHAPATTAPAAATVTNVTPAPDAPAPLMTRTAPPAALPSPGP